MVLGPDLSATTVTGIELVGATILVTVLVFGGWDRHRDVKPPIVAAIDTFPLTLASFRHAGQLPISNTA